MTNSDTVGKLSKTKFLGSLMKTAVNGDMFNSNESIRSKSWGFWIIDNLREFKGIGNRDYFGILLPGSFYNTNVTKEVMNPHLELSNSFLDESHPYLSPLIANAGNAILSGAWVYPEVKALKKSLLENSHMDGDIAISTLFEFRESLVRELESINKILEPDWDEFERLIVSSPESLIHILAEGFDTKDLKSLLHKVDIESITVNFSKSLLGSSGENSIKRIGIWDIVLVDKNNKTQKMFAVVPRLTRNSLFHDKLYNPEKEGILSLLVRVLLMRKIYATINSTSLTRSLIKESKNSKTKPYYKALVPKVGEKLPEASTDAAILLLQSYNNSSHAWLALQEWAKETYILTVTEKQFRDSFDDAKILLKRAEKPDREIIDNLLSLCWDKKSRVVRVTYSNPKKIN
jgi:hypothetical protein